MTTAPLLPAPVHDLLETLWEGQVPLPLAFALWSRDEETFHHGLRVALLSSVVTEALGMDRPARSQVALGAFLHDVGKVRLDLGLLRKPAAFTRTEYETMQGHAAWGHGLLNGAGLTALAPVALSHHERWDGEGYPRRLRGHQIPLAARITSVVDAFDAMTHDRPYRKAMDPQAAMQELVDGRGRQFAPDVVDVFRWAEARIFDLAG